MKSKGRTAWLITWEGTESDRNGKCKVAAILPANYREETIILSLRVLFHSESVLTLCEKMVPIASIHKDPYFKIAYRDINPEYCYGHLGKRHLTARKVENLRCEESKTDSFATTLYWTERERFIQDPDWNPNGPMPVNPADSIKQVRCRRDEHYTYSIRTSV
jgi:hypothetical protein